MVKGMLCAQMYYAAAVFFLLRRSLLSLISFARSSARTKILVMCAILRKSNTYHTYPSVRVGIHDVDSFDHVHYLCARAENLHVCSVFFTLLSR